MPWNEPGSNNNGSGRDKENESKDNREKDIWGNNGSRNNGSNQPPDIDEVIKGFTDKLNKMFGGSGSSGGDGKNTNNSSQEPNMFSPKVLGFVAAIALLLWFVTGFYTVQQGKQGVVLRFGKFVTTVEAGLHWRANYIDTVDIIDTSKYNTVEVGYSTGSGSSQNRNAESLSEALMLTEDENIIDISIAVQYNINDPKKLLFNVIDGREDDVVRQATESAIREIVGRNTMDFVLTDGRGPIASETKSLLQKILDRYQTGIQVLAIELQNAQPPTQVKAAFDDAVKAREDRERSKNLAEAYSNGVLPAARGQAAKIIENAVGYKKSTIERSKGDAARFSSILEEYRKAPEITRDRMYLETMEEVMSNSSKLFIDQQNNGQGSVFYLPLDKIVSQQQESVRLNDNSTQVQSKVNEASSNQSRPATNNSSNNVIRQGRSVQQ